MGNPVIRRVWERRLAGDEGFTLLETVVALVVFALMATGIAGVLITSMATDRLGRGYQQATRVAEQAMETARSQSYATLATSSTDLAAAASTDTTLKTSSTCTSAPAGMTYYFIPDGLNCEAIVSSSSGLPLHPTSSTSGYSIEQYVTWVSKTTQGDTGKDYKRITTHVTWTVNGRSKSYYTMTTVSDVTPIPTYRDLSLSTTNASATAVPGYQAVFQYLVTNKGSSSDAFNVSVTDGSGNPITWTKSLYYDTYLDGSPQPYGKASPATLLTDTNSDGTVDTGTLADSSQSCTPPYSSTSTCAQILLALTVPSNASGTYTFVLTATSTHASTATQSVTTTLAVSSTPAASTLYFHNVTCCPTPVSSTQTLDMPMDTNQPTAVTEPSYSTNKSNTSGRYIAHGGTSSTTQVTSMADWIYGTLPTASTFNGNITGTVYVQGCNPGTNSTSVTAYFGNATSGGDSGSTSWIANSGAVTVPPPTPNTDCTGSKVTAINFSIPVANVTFGQQEVMELKIVVSGNKDGIIAYDATQYPSMISLPVVAT